MLSLNKAIKSYEKIAEENEKDAEQFKRIKATKDIASYCYECAKEHRQLAEWLKELKAWREFGRNNAQFINDCLLNNYIDELFSSGFKDDADILRITNETLTLRTTNEFCKSFNERFERRESDSE